MWRKRTEGVGISRQPPPVQIMTDQKQLQNMEYFSFLGSMVKAAFIRKKAFHLQIRVKFEEQTSEVLHLELRIYGAETLIFRKVDQKYLESYEMWCWRRMEKIIWTDSAGNEKVLHRVKEKRNIVHRIKRRKANWVGQILCRDCLKTHC
jgi:hypothetical protein